MTLSRIAHRDGTYNDNYFITDQEEVADAKLFLYLMLIIQCFSSLHLVCPQSRWMESTFAPLMTRREPPKSSNDVTAPSSSKELICPEYFLDKKIDS